MRDVGREMAVHGGDLWTNVAPKNPRCPILWANDASKSEIIAAEGRELLESEGVYVDARFFVKAATKIVQASIHEEWLTIRK